MKKRRLPKLSRGQQTVLYLLLLPLVCVLLWGKNRFPIRDPHLSLRRAEAQNLVGPSDIQAVVRAGAGYWTMGVYMDQVLLNMNSVYAGNSLYYWPRTEGGPTLVPVPGSSTPSDAAEMVALAAVDLPEGTAYPQLELSVSCWYYDRPATAHILSARAEDLSSMPEDGVSREEREQLGDAMPRKWEKTYTVYGQMLEDGGCVFWVRSTEAARDPSTGQASIESLALACVEDWDTYDPGWSVQARKINCSMEAVFFSRDGAELGRAVLRTPEEADP